jgi:hypothetical protein
MDESPTLLAVYLIDLRAQLEAQLRHLTTFQRSLELYRGTRADEGKLQYRHEMLQQLRLLIGSNVEIDQSLTEAERQTKRLTPSDSPATRRRSRPPTRSKSARRRVGASR